MNSDRKKINPSQSAEQKRHESEEQLSLLQTITTELTTAEDLSSALEVVLRDVCEKTGWVVGHAWVPNQDGTDLEFRSAWYCGDGELGQFRAVSEGLHFKPGVGLPGRVWESKRPAWVENVTDDPNFPRSTAARTAGLKTGVGIPILSGKKVIAVLEFFMRESRAQNERLLNVIASVAGQLDLLHRATHAEAAARERSVPDSGKLHITARLDGRQRRLHFLVQRPLVRLHRNDARGDERMGLAEGPSPGRSGSSG